MGTRNRWRISRPRRLVSSQDRQAARLLRQAAADIDGNGLWYRSNGYADYFVMGHRTRGSHFGRRGDYINRMSGLPFVWEELELSDYDGAYRCADGQLRLTAADVLGEPLWDIGVHPVYRAAYEAATRVVAETTRSTCDNLEAFNDDPGLCGDSRTVADVFRKAAASLDGNPRW